MRRHVKQCLDALMCSSCYSVDFVRSLVCIWIFSGFMLLLLNGSWKLESAMMWNKWPTRRVAAPLANDCSCMWQVKTDTFNDHMCLTVSCDTDKCRDVCAHALVSVVFCRNMGIFVTCRTTAELLARVVTCTRSRDTGQGRYDVLSPLMCCYEVWLVLLHNCLCSLWSSLSVTHKDTDADVCFMSV